WSAPSQTQMTFPKEIRRKVIGKASHARQIMEVPTVFQKVLGYTAVSIWMVVIEAITSYIKLFVIVAQAQFDEMRTKVRFVCGKNTNRMVIKVGNDGRRSGSRRIVVHL